MNKLLTLTIATGLFFGSAAWAGEYDTSSAIWVDGPNDIQPGSDRSRPDVSIAPDGTRVYVWHANTTRTDIYARRIAANGDYLENPFLVNTTTAEEQQWPRVAVQTDGSYLIIWQSREPNDREVRSQAFNSSSGAQNAELLLSALSTGLKSVDLNAEVASLRSVPASIAAYAVVWNSGASNGSDDSGRSIQARLVSGSGLAVGQQFQVNNFITGTQSQPAVSELADGGFVVTWRNPDGANDTIRARRFDATGSPVADEFVVNTTLPGPRAEPDVTIGPDDKIMIAWEEGDTESVRGRIFNSSLNPEGPDFQINNEVSRTQFAIRVAGFPPHGFLAAWKANKASGVNDFDTVQGRIISAPSQFPDPQTQLSKLGASSQGIPSIHGTNGEIGLVWDANSPQFENDDDIEAYHIYGWSVCGLFCDSFESGTP